MTVPVDNDSVTHGDTFTWDAENRLTSATVDSATTDFAYNGDGLRDSLTYDSNTTTFTWDVNASVPQVLDDGDFRYVYGLGRIAEVDGSDNAHYYLADGLGSTIALTDDSGAVENTYVYDPFDAIVGATGTQDNAFTFTGEQTDPSTGLEYLRARYYDPQTGRFVSRDPLAAIPFWPEHAYTYVGSGPQNFVDPNGLFSLGSVGSAIHQTIQSGVGFLGSCNWGKIAEAAAVVAVGAGVFYGGAWVAFGGIEILGEAGTLGAVIEGAHTTLVGGSILSGSGLLFYAGFRALGESGCGHHGKE